METRNPITGERKEREELKATLWRGGKGKPGGGAFS